MGFEGPSYRHNKQTLQVAMPLALARPWAQQQLQSSLSSPKSKSGGYTHSGPDPFPCTQGQVKTRLIKATGSRDLTPPSSPTFPHTRVPSPQGWKPGAEREGGLPTAIPLTAMQGGQLCPRRAHNRRGVRSWQVSGRTGNKPGLEVFSEAQGRSNRGFRPLDKSSLLSACELLPPNSLSLWTMHDPKSPPFLPYWLWL